MKILFCNDPSLEVIDEFSAQNWQIDVLKKLGKPLDEVIADYQGLVIGEENALDFSLLKKAERLKVIGILSKDILNIDQEAATSLGITIVNISRSIAPSIAEYTIGQILYLARLRRKWQHWELEGKVLGIIGFGQAGAALAKKAHALGMEIKVYDPSLSEARAKAYKIQSVSLVDILIAADVVSIHVPLKENTCHLLNAELLKLCRKKCLLINNSLPEILGKEAILSFLNSSKEHLCAFDYPHSHQAYYAELKNHPQVMLTENKATDTSEASKRSAEELAEEMKAVILTGMSENAINVPTIAPKKMPYYAPYLKMAALLGFFLGQYIKDELSEIVLYDYEQTISDTAPVLQHLLQYLLSAMGYEDVNYVNALSRVFKLKIAVHSNKDKHGKGLGLRVRLKSGKENYLHVVLSDGKVRLTGIDRHQLDFELKEHMLLIYHADKPGVVGLVGSMLGACSINIIGMTLDNSLSPKENALMLVTLDSKIDDDFIKVVSKYDNVYEVYYINLPAEIYQKFDEGAKADLS